MSERFMGLRPRVLGRLEAPTPLVVPSFSSRGFPAVDDILRAVAPNLYGPCLVSAYDLAHGLVTAEITRLADVVVVDSGGYEMAIHPPGLGGNHTPPGTMPWSREDLRAWLRGLPPAAPAVVVAFDAYAEVDQQIAAAQEDFGCAPSAARCLLLKPTELGGALPLDALGASVVSELQVLGVTEDELGTSAAERCHTLVRLRHVVGDELPIHVFGTLTPRSMLAYALCGADVFDGLNWLRCAYQAGGARSLADVGTTPDDWDLRDDLRRAEVWRRNLAWLGRFQGWLRRVAVGEACVTERSPLDRAEVDACMELARRCGAAEGR